MYFGRVLALEEERFDFAISKAEDLAVAADKEHTLVWIDPLTTEGIFISTHDGGAS